MREEFVSLREGFNPETDKIIELAKIILMNAPCSKSALMNPMDFLFQEGEGKCNSTSHTNICVFHFVCSIC